MDAGVLGQAPYISLNGTKKSIAEARALTFVKDPAAPEVRFGAVKEPDVHASQSAVH